MTILKKKAIYMLLVAVVFCLGSCVDKETPTRYASEDQVAASSSSLGMLVSGLKSKMISYCNYYTDPTSWYATQDWGYGCYMLIKETMLDGFPTTGSSWNYQHNYEAATNLVSYTAPVYYYYYNLTALANRVLAAAGEATSETMLQYRGTAYLYRALAYMDLALMFEFWPTGDSSMDAKASDIWGLTVPIVTENTTSDEAKNNPRADFTTMYRFIYRDLSLAKEYLAGCERSEKSDVNEDVANGLLARFWITLAARFNKYPSDLQKQVAAENADDGYENLGITTAADCYTRAKACAEAVMNAGYTPTTKAQWHDVTSGFNTANQAWVWDMRLTSISQYSGYWCSIMGLVASEPIWAIPSYSGEYRCISYDLYNNIQEGDWRKTSWIAPEDAGATVVPDKYETLLKDETASTKVDQTNFSRLPAYANLKFRPGSGSLDDEQTGMLADIPLIRVEEMYFIAMEADLMLSGVAAGQTALESFMNSYRMEGATYTCHANSQSTMLEEIIAQKYVELWGEGLLYNDYKRLGLSIVRNSEGSNYLDVYKEVNYTGSGCASWLNFYLPETARTYNQALAGKMNPDPTPSK